VRGREGERRDGWWGEVGEMEAQKETHHRIAVGQITIGSFSLLGRRSGTSCA